MLKRGKYRALRNIPVGWLVQAIHSTDRSEMLFRLFLEALALPLAATALHRVTGWDWVLVFVVAFAAVHTATWLVTGNFWVYLLDSFSFVQNRGLAKNLKYVENVRHFMERYDCADSVTIYGSMCRGQFHDRSDLDLRVVRRSDSVRGMWALVGGIWFRCLSFFWRLPVDLQVVDSNDFLRRQMRADERPIAVYERRRGMIVQPGWSFDEVRANPTLVTRR